MLVSGQLSSETKHAKKRLVDPFPDPGRAGGACFIKGSLAPAKAWFAHSPDELVVLACRKQNSNLGMISIKLDMPSKYG